MHLVGGGRAIVEGVDSPAWPKRRGQVQSQPSASCPRLPPSTIIDAQPGRTHTLARTRTSTRTRRRGKMACSMWQMLPQKCK
jgi:hypothetical protein